VLRPYTTLKVSLRLPPTINADKASQQLKEFFEEVRLPRPRCHSTLLLLLLCDAKW
jgi:hypothetical protein